MDTLTRRELVAGVASLMAGRGGGMEHFDVVILGGTPGGICAAVGAARLGSKVLLLERTAHIGGLPANGLGATDIASRGATGGLFLEFVRRVKAHYVTTYGKDSAQAKACSDGYHFEPQVAEKVFNDLLAGQANVTVRLRRQFDAEPGNVRKDGSRLTEMTVTRRDDGEKERYTADVFIDATYEGDLAAAAGCAFETRREGKAEYGEPFAGRVYRRWGTGELGAGSTEEGDDTLQAYNYRLCLTDRAENRILPEKPRDYRREDYASLVGDAQKGYLKHFFPKAKPGEDVGVFNPVTLPNGKTDSNNHHRSFVSSDLPEENWPYPRADWKWRDRFAERLRSYTLGLLWFSQNDPEMPESFRAEARRWGLAKDEYADNGHFPRQMYVREGRRVTGEYLFTAKDAIAPEELADAYHIMAGRKEPMKGLRAPLREDSITASHYPIDSHAVRKREPDRVHLDGFLGLARITRPYQVPYGVIVPKSVDGLLIPVPVSSTHLGYGTLRMEPCWMALGHAAGVAAHLSRVRKVMVRALPVPELQAQLLKEGQVLIYLADVPISHPCTVALQRAGCKGCFPRLNARPDEPVDAETARDWASRAGVADEPTFVAGRTTRGEYAALLFR